MGPIDQGSVGPYIEHDSTQTDVDDERSILSGSHSSQSHVQPDNLNHHHTADINETDFPEQANTAHPGTVDMATEAVVVRENRRSDGNAKSR